MTRDHAAAYINAINVVQRFIPPVMFADLMNGPVAQMLVGVASGQVVCEIKPVEKAQE